MQQRQTRPKSATMRSEMRSFRIPAPLSVSNGSFDEGHMPRFCLSRASSKTDSCSGFLTPSSVGAIATPSAPEAADNPVPQKLGDITARGAMALSRMPSPERLLAQAFSKTIGCSGSDTDLLVLILTIDVAKVVCFGLSGCKGFTFQGLETIRPVTVYFKSRWSAGAPTSCWTSYMFEPNAAKKKERSSLGSLLRNSRSSPTQERNSRSSPTLSPQSGGGGLSTSPAGFQTPLSLRHTSSSNPLSPSGESLLGAQEASLVASSSAPFGEWSPIRRLDQTGTPGPRSPLKAGDRGTMSSFASQSPIKEERGVPSLRQPTAITRTMEAQPLSSSPTSLNGVNDMLHAVALQWQCAARTYLARDACCRARATSGALLQLLRLHGLEAHAPVLSGRTLQEFLFMSEEELVDLCIDAGIKRQERQRFRELLRGEASRRKLEELLQPHGLDSWAQHFQAYGLQMLLRKDEGELLEICHTVGLRKDQRKKAAAVFLAEQRAIAEVAAAGPEEDLLDFQRRAHQAERAQARSEAAQAAAQREVEALRAEVEDLRVSREASVRQH